jgi:hypothetical protein
LSTALALVVAADDAAEGVDAPDAAGAEAEVEAEVEPVDGVDVVAAV